MPVSRARVCWFSVKRAGQPPEVLGRQGERHAEHDDAQADVEQQQALGTEVQPNGLNFERREAPSVGGRCLRSGGPGGAVWWNPCPTKAKI